MEANRFAIAYLLTAVCSPIDGVAKRTGTQFPTCKTNVTNRYTVGCVKGNLRTLLVSRHAHACVHTIILLS